MKFSQMLSFWTLKDMISKVNIISGHTEHDTGVEHYIVSIRVQANSSLHAIILYRQEGERLSLIHSSIFFSGYKYRTDALFIKNASVAKLRREFVDRL